MALRVGCDPELAHPQPADHVHPGWAGDEPGSTAPRAVTSADGLEFHEARGWLDGSPLGLVRDGAVAVCAQAAGALLRALGIRTDYESIVSRGTALRSSGAAAPTGDRTAATRGVTRCRRDRGS